MVKGCGKGLANGQVSTYFLSYSELATEVVLSLGLYLLIFPSLYKCT